MALKYENLVGKQEDWANYITTVEMRDTPLMDWLPIGKKPTNVKRSVQVDRFRPPRKNAHIDGQPFKTAASAGANRERMETLVQWFDEGVNVSKLSEDVTDNAAIESELAREVPKKLKEMAQDMEVAFGEDGDCVEGDEAVGYETRGMGSWINNSAQATYPVPALFRTPAASISTTAIASQTEDGVRNVLGSMWRQSKSQEKVTGIVGETLKRKFSDFQFYLPSSASTQASGVTFNYEGRDKTILRAIDLYHGDYMPVELVLSPWLVALTGTVTAIAGRGYFLHRSKWELAWNQKPKVYRPEFKGGSYEAFMDAIIMLVCKNPLGEGKLAPA